MISDFITDLKLEGVFCEGTFTCVSTGEIAWRHLRTTHYTHFFFSLSRKLIVPLCLKRKIGVNFNSKKNINLLWYKHRKKILCSLGYYIVFTFFLSKNSESNIAYRTFTTITSINIEIIMMLWGRPKRWGGSRAMHNFFFVIFNWSTPSVWWQILS